MEVNLGAKMILRDCINKDYEPNIDFMLMKDIIPNKIRGFVG